MKKALLFIGILTFSSTGWAQDDGPGDDPIADLGNVETESAPESVASDPAPAASVTTAPAPQASPSVWGTKSVNRKGMWAIGVDAAPVLNLGLNVINLFNNTGQDATNVLNNPANYDQTFAVKYYLRDDLAIRGLLRLGATNTTTITYYEDPRDVVDPDKDAGSRAEVQDSTTQNASVLGVGGGAEWRHSFGRFEGFCGAEGLLGMSSSSTENTYGWAYTDEDIIPPEQTSRIISEDYGTSISLGARGFLGVEYFLLPELSLAAEYGMGGSFNLTPNGVVVTEVWETSVNDDGEVTGSAKKREAKTDASQVVALANDMGFGQTTAGSAFALRLNFHF